MREPCHDEGVGGDDSDDPMAGTGGGADGRFGAVPIRAGTLLIASPSLTESSFARTVVYVIEHDEGGSIGVVINQPSHSAVHNLLPRWSDLAANPKALFVGGPVKRDGALCLGVAERGVDIHGVEGVMTVSGRVVLVDLDTDPDEVAPLLVGVRIMAGYAGWGPGQLDDELGEDSWLVASAMADDVLAPAGVDLWASVLRRQPWPLPLLATYPMDVTAN
ncbi:YqgE/AlgH family protein [Gordonia sp. (in: high G+C Gram-positive bacteria)]|uniref:YqgE/AlgH family protein n=2 Tax=Gordonia TaxID=2053 RepID=UPI000FAE0CE5|nr:MAG: YqgE/AlgH family protein [Gordonia sp. (in: high G+C Gram-positive bacteria)]